MDQIKKYMNPKWWLIVTGVLFLLANLVNYITAADVATVGFEGHYDTLSDRELAIAEHYEQGWGLFGIPYGIFAISVGLLFGKKEQAKMAMVAGITFIVLFPILLFVGNSNNYVVPVEQFAPLFVVLLGLVASGYLHLEDGEGGSE